MIIFLMIIYNNMKMLKKYNNIIIQHNKSLLSYINYNTNYNILRVLIVTNKLIKKIKK